MIDLYGVTGPKSEVPQRQIQMVCDRCGGTDVLRDAWASWSVDAQSWELDSTFQWSFCRECDGETSLSELPVRTD